MRHPVNESAATKVQPSRSGSTQNFIIREPPHQQQSQQHNFAAPRKGIFNSTALSNVQTTNSIVRNVPNKKDHNKENLTAGQTRSDTNDSKLASASGSTLQVGSPKTPAVAANK